jgi:hypothetical protein
MFQKSRTYKKYFRSVGEGRYTVVEASEGIIGSNGTRKIHGVEAI